MAARKRQRTLSQHLVRLAPLGSMAGLGTMAAANGAEVLAALLGIGALISGRRLLDRRRNARKELLRRVRANAAELRRVGRADGIAAPQMKRLAGLQEGLLESWDLLPEGYRPLLFEDLYTVVDEVESAALLARRRSALRRHLESVDRRAVMKRIRDLERDVEGLEEDSALRVSLEAALEGRRGELVSYEEIPRAIGKINAQLEGIESLLGNLRGELLALDANPTSLSAESNLVGLRRRISYFRQSLDEVRRSVDHLPGGDASGDHLGLPERMTAR